MPRPPKRRSEAISREDGSESESDDSPARPSRSRVNTNNDGSNSRRRRSPQSPASSDSNGESRGGEDGNSDVDADSDNTETQADRQKKALVQKLVRLALSCEFSRVPLRRSDISAKIFKDGAGNSQARGRQFKPVFEEAQKQLRHVFGMQLVELPQKEKTSLKERRNQATQTKAPSTTSKSWILVSMLPKGYKEHSGIVQAARLPTLSLENAYTAFYTLVVTLIYLNANELTEQKLERYLARLHSTSNTPAGPIDKTLARMIREGYIDRKRENVGGEDQVSYSVGPRGKVEVGIQGVTGLVKTVYGLGAVELPEGPKIEEAELDSRLARSLGIDAFRRDQTRATLDDE